MVSCAASDYRARYYDSNAGRFASEDPTAFRGGTVNFYVYANNSALNFWDPFGLTTWPTNYPVVTDPFGTIEPIRGGRIHKGEDIRNPMGGVVCASDSGTVIGILLGASLQRNALARRDASEIADLS